VERDSQFMLREGSTSARGALLSRAEYAIPALDIPVTNTSVRGPAMAWLLAEEDFASAAQVLDPGIGTLSITASWTPIACCGRTSDRARCPGSPSSPSPPIWDPPGFSSRPDSGQQALRSPSLAAPSSPTVPDLGNHRFMSHRSATSPKSVLSVGAIGNHLMHEPMAYPGMPWPGPWHARGQVNACNTTCPERRRVHQGRVPSWT
jgi:hypothetical protein